MANRDDNLVFCALGGLGEIGMNAALYGFGPPNRRKWIMVDCGLSFAGPELPGIDLVIPDISFVESIRRDLLALIITHAHEDHIGAVADLWPKLGCPVYATRFAAGLLEVKRLNEPGAPRIPITIMKPGQRLDLAPFEVEIISMAHSVPESTGLAIRTPVGLVVHSGDWKIDPTPFVGEPTDEARLREIGQEGVLALVCDSTNIMRPGVSPSETEVADRLREIIEHSPGRVVVTTFASNVARLRAVAVAAAACGRSVIVLGRAMDRVIGVARECGYLDGVAPFLSSDALAQLPRERVVILATGSQGEVRAALARIAQDDHPDARLTQGDRVIFSSRTIPGNEREVGKIINGLIRQGIEVVTDRTELVHVSGHPRREEVAQLYGWLKPHIAIPAHGEPLHLSEHAAFARSIGVPHVIRASDGDVVLIGPDEPGIIADAPHGRIAKDGNMLVPVGDPSIAARNRLAFAGVVSIAFAISARGELTGTPDVVFSGLPSRTRDGQAMDAVIDAAIFDTLDNLGRNKRRDADATSTAVERAVRGQVGAAWGKKPTVHVLVVEV
ncbi:ribonuclease J [Lichenifustis flavocetrariae]|uniref:Ribonuclease J n=1 Tax=Lichenifustis flavocetrariae TaxID=2949735 RepID=A0AA42CNT6_9HYPH|nr:ribonuclease J [Lichenifustis flavocetrariae]MCW6509710.1 ribonuclease J [Lichenifustis flavocetrariae]